MLNNQQQHKGMTLLELLLVLIIAASIIFLGINRYQLYKRQKDIEVLRQNVNSLFQATNTYYRLNCRNGQPFQVFIVNLMRSGLMPPLTKSDLVTPGTYQVGATKIGQTQQTKKDIYQLWVSANLNIPPTDTLTMQTYQQMLNASAFKGNQLTWIRLPSYSIPTMASGLWISESELRQFKESATSQQGDNTCAY